jgi:putative membrane protein
MKTCLRWSPVLLLAAASTGLAADAAAPVAAHARTVGEALLYMLVFAVAGIVMAILGYKLFDKFTPGDLHKEIVEKQNVAAAVIAAAVVLGICIIIAAAMIG